MFKIDRDAILKHTRLVFLDGLLPINDYLTLIERGINDCFDPEKVVQHGRVIALRHTDEDRLASAFKSAIYLEKYSDMANTKRFLTKMVKAGHSYEPIRGESILFLFIGVGKPVYDHLVTYSVGRYTRIAGGQRANMPWGIEVPVEAKDKEYFKIKMKELIEEALNVPREQLQAVRSIFPVGYIMPPFLLEFSEEALIKNVFTQRIFQKGAQGATAEVVRDMYECCVKIDKGKWSMLEDYHGPHIESWKKVMRTLRDKLYTISEVLEKCGLNPEEMSKEEILHHYIYHLLMLGLGKQEKTMWDKGGTEDVQSNREDT